MKNSGKDPFEELKKDSEKGKRKLKFAGRVFSCLYLILFLGIGILIFNKLGEGIDLNRAAIIFFVAAVYTFLSIWIGKKIKGTKDYHLSMKFIRLIIILLMFLTFYIVTRLTSQT